MLHRTARRWAAGGAATALAAAALVSMTTTTAEATTGPYTCTVLGNPVPLDITMTPTLIPPTAPAGFPVTPAFIGVTMSTLLPKDLVDAFTALAVDDITSSDLGMTMGPTAIPIDGLHLAGPLELNPDGSGVLTAEGANGAFTTPAAGTYDVLMPASFTLTPTSAGVARPDISCATDAPETVSSVTLTKQASTTTASLEKAKIQKGKKATVNAKVTRDYGKAAGKVKVLKKNGTVIGQGTLNNKGKVSITTSKFKQTGKYTLTVKYVGDGFAKPSSDKVTLKVVK